MLVLLGMLIIGAIWATMYKIMYVRSELNG